MSGPCNNAEHLQYGKHACNICTPPNKGPVSPAQVELLRTILNTSNPFVRGGGYATLHALLRRKLVSGTHYKWFLTDAGKEVLARESAPKAAKPDALSVLTDALRRIAAKGTAEEPDAECYDDTESAYNNGVEVAAYEAAEIARKALADIGVQS